ncbi:MAG: hypothetical protein LC104_09565 [Bacteroidales bacterium]|nr:hypothetical protein [Bacteroidales bacterium]
MRRMEFELTRDDVLRVTPEVLVREPFFQQLKHKSRQNARAFIGVGLFLVLLMGFLEGVLGVGPVLSVILGISILFLGVAGWSTDAKLRKLARTNLTVALTVDPAYQAGLGPRAYELFLDRFQVEMAHGQGIFFWSCIIRTVRLPDDFVVVAPGPSNHIFPRDIFADDHTFTEFMAEVEQRIIQSGGQIGDSHETTD